MESPWQPPENYQFPFSVHKKGGTYERRFVRRDHLLKYPWLVISPIEKGLYCKYCTLFVTGHVGGYTKSVTLQKLVTKPLQSFSKLLGQDGALDVHNNNLYHRQAVTSATQFLRSYHNPEKEIINQISFHRLVQIKENRERLKPIIKTLIFLGRQNIPLRGHRDEGNINLSSEVSEASYESPINQGNFKELLRFRVEAGDKTLENHLNTANSRATYISKTTQNELIESIGDEILSTILQRVRKSKLYSIMFDETTDVAHISQLSLIIRYIDEGCVREDFIKFTDAYKYLQDEYNEVGSVNEPVLSGEYLGKIVTNILKQFDLDLSNCVGIGTDGCNVMVSEATGAVNEIQKEAKNAVRCPCYNHALNLSISKSSCVQSVRNSIGVMKHTISFFRASAKRNIVLKNVLGGQVSTLCETRWVERHTTVLQFRADLKKIVQALEIISQWQELETASKARSLIAALSESEFIISIVSLSDVLSITLPLSRYLQKEEVSLDRASEFVQSTIKSLDEKRINCEKQFDVLFKECKQIALSLGKEIKMPRLVGRQEHRSNPPVSMSQQDDYYRISVYIPIIESITQDLKVRFSQESLQIYGLTTLIPKMIVSEDLTDENNKREILKRLLNCITQFGSTFDINIAAGEQQITGELLMWKNIYEYNKDNIPRNAILSYNACDEDVFPIIKRLLHVLVVLPASVTSAERSFSTLRRLKTWIRSRMGEERLTGLALMNIHRDIDIDVEKVIDRYSRKSHRRLDFVV